MGRRYMVMVALVWFVLLGDSSTINGSRHTHFFKVKPTLREKTPPSTLIYYDLLPKAVPIPPSGPSKEHDNIGLQTSKKMRP
ncbi:protein IDA-LIKE 2-like [Tripterygium wilfordii]|uniref:Protein IDA-LIKE 2-like n=1 Tax=Tripterygium wilfordii TaxID=458696 RepID=A0A7J7CMW0_TRIWF|nr:protein IDA-LIKE 2-like [Tripterygium wilfordii]